MSDSDTPPFSARFRRFRCFRGSLRRDPPEREGEREGSNAACLPKKKTPESSPNPRVALWRGSRSESGCFGEKHYKQAQDDGSLRLGRAAACSNVRRLMAFFVFFFAKLEYLEYLEFLRKLGTIETSSGRVTEAARPASSSSLSHPLSALNSNARLAETDSLRVGAPPKRARDARPRSNSNARRRAELLDFEFWNSVLLCFAGAVSRSKEEQCASHSLTTKLALLSVGNSEVVLSRRGAARTSGCV